MSPFFPLLLLAGCAVERLEPSVDLAADPVLAALPADATVVARATPSAAALQPWVAAGLLDLDALPLTELPAGLAGACGDAGCVALIDGPVEPWVAPDAGQHRWEGSVAGHPVTWRRLAWDKAVAGERGAVDALSASRAAGEPGLDLSAWAGVVPEGDAWVLAWDAPRLAALARQRGLVPPELPAQAERVLAVAVALRLEGDRVDLVARALLVDEQSARLAARLLRGARLEGPAAELLDGAEVVQVGPYVEVRGPFLDPATAWRLAEEVAP